MEKERRAGRIGSIMKPGRGPNGEKFALHLLKLCVGCSSIAELEEWVADKSARDRHTDKNGGILHTTRMVPTRIGEILGGGSLFWVIKGQIACRQRILDIQHFTDVDGIGRCHLVLKPLVITVEPRPFRAFQGWRYLDHKDAPPDIAHESGIVAMPEALRRELAVLGLL